MSGSRDPGPPPAKGLVVRPDGDGFHARIWPRPKPPWASWAAGVFMAGAVGVVLALAVTRDLDEGIQVAIAATIFLSLLGLAPFLVRHAPVELAVDDHQVYWNGDRFPMSAVRGARADGQVLELLGDYGALARFEHLAPDVAGWLAAAILASLPEGVPEPPLPLE
ncbi:MAG: hypothetical protein H6738_11380 [Alphaproteobacteria bacterium]|nr:hypothetical protein [Alphaproteobacteria bacterium]MCB9697372.1 hypothetical protein [Alphaproteobacteria bacterium]